MIRSVTPGVPCGYTSVVGSLHPHQSPEQRGQFAQFQLRAQGVRRLGSAALDCAWTALGRLDGYWGSGIKPWDIAAGGLLVREAGGRATSTEGDEDFISTGTIVASNGLLHEQILRVLREGNAAPLPQ